MKHKKLILIILSILATTGCAVGAAACGNGDKDKDKDTHVHTLNHVEAAAANCTQAGRSEYWECTDCGKYYSDAEGNSEIADLNSLTVSIDENAHKWGEWEVVSEATCTSPAKEKRTCTHNGSHTDERNGNTTLAHTLTHVEAKETSCTEAGNEEYWKCSVCLNYYADGQGQR